MRRDKLPFEILQTACMMFAGKTGFTQAEMRELFSPEVEKHFVPLNNPNDKNIFSVVAVAMEKSNLRYKLHPQNFNKRSEALEYWLSMLPLWRQKEILAELCRKPNFPMTKGYPSHEDCARLITLLHAFVIDKHVAQVLQNLSSTHIQSLWQKAIDRCANDPEGAITSARTLLESVCKYILEVRSVNFPTDEDLPKLFYLVLETLKIAPNQQTDKTFKQILGACQSVVNGVGELRNRLSDAHGRGTEGNVAVQRHVMLAVNLSGSLALYLLQTWESELSV